MSREDDLKRLFDALFKPATQATGFKLAKSTASNDYVLANMSYEEKKRFTLRHIFEAFTVFWVGDGEGEVAVEAADADEAIEIFSNDLPSYDDRSSVVTLTVRDRHGDHVVTRKVVVDPPVPCKGGEWVTSKEAGPFYTDHAGIKYHSMCSCPKRHQRTESSGMTDPATGLPFSGIIYHNEDGFFDEDEEDEEDDDDEDDRYGSR